jgi:endoribonuclease Dicer
MSLSVRQLKSCRNLELYLDSKIATASQLSQIHHFVRRSKEEAWIQGRLERPFRTELYSLMESRFGESEDLKLIFRFAWQASSELSRWCSGGVWKHVFSAKLLPKLE